MKRNIGQELLDGIQAIRVARVKNPRLIFHPSVSSLKPLKPGLVTFQHP